MHLSRSRYPLATSRGSVYFLLSLDDARRDSKPVARRRAPRDVDLNVNRADAVDLQVRQRGFEQVQQRLIPARDRKLRLALPLGLRRRSAEELTRALRLDLRRRILLCQTSQKLARRLR